MQAIKAGQAGLRFYCAVIISFFLTSTPVCFAQFSLEQSSFYRILPGIEGYLTSSPPPYEFRVTLDPFGWRMTLDHAGKGKLVNSKSKETRTFHISVEQDEWIEKMYYCIYKKDFIFLYEVTTGPEGSARIARLDHKALAEIWVRNIPAFNLGPPMQIEDAALVTGIGLVGRVNLDNGEFDWVHDRLYGSGGIQDSFNSFDEPFIINEMVVFPESPGSLFNRWPASLSVDLRSGAMVQGK